VEVRRIISISAQIRETLKRWISMYSWRTFWKMTLNTLKALEISQDELEERFKDSRWPVIPPSAKPPTGFVVDQVSFCSFPLANGNFERVF